MGAFSFYHSREVKHESKNDEGDDDRPHESEGCYETTKLGENITDSEIDIVSF